MQAAPPFQAAMTSLSQLHFHFPLLQTSAALPTYIGDMCSNEDADSEEASQTSAVTSASPHSAQFGAATCREEGRDALQARVPSADEQSSTVCVLQIAEDANASKGAQVSARACPAGTSAAADAAGVAVYVAADASPSTSSSTGTTSAAKADQGEELGTVQSTDSSLPRDGWKQYRHEARR